MKLNDEQIAQYERDGYLVLPQPLPKQTVDRLRAELKDACTVQDERIVRERDGSTARIVYGVHDLAAPTGRKAFAQLAVSPELATPIQQLLRDEELYIVHSKCNLKQGLVGEPWSWHQDFGTWGQDGIASPEVATALVMLDEATEIGGCLYFIPGSHKAGTLPPEKNMNSATYLLSLSQAQMRDLVGQYGEPVAIKGKPGTVVIFHSNIAHGSGHNMSIHARWQLYLVYNTVANRPRPVDNPRPEWKSERNVRPLSQLAMS